MDSPSASVRVVQRRVELLVDGQRIGHDHAGAVHTLVALGPQHVGDLLGRVHRPVDVVARCRR